MGESDIQQSAAGIWKRLADWVRNSVLKFFNNVRIRWHIFSLDSDAREPSINKLAEIGEPAVPALINTLKNKNQLVRCGAIEALGGTGNEKAVPHLMDLLKDENDEIRGTTVEALGKIEDARVIPALITILKDKNDEIRRRSASALANFAEKGVDISAAVPSLISALKDDNYSAVRSCATSAFGYTGDTRAVPALLEALKDDDMQFVTFMALGKIVAKLLDKGEYLTALEIIKDSTNVIMKSSGKKKDRYSLEERRGRLRNLAEFTQKIHDNMSPDKRRGPMKFSAVAHPKKPHPAGRKRVAVYR